MLPKRLCMDGFRKTVFNDEERCRRLSQNPAKITAFSSIPAKVAVMAFYNSGALCCSQQLAQLVTANLALGGHYCKGGSNGCLQQWCPVLLKTCM